MNRQFDIDIANALGYEIKMTLINDYEFYSMGKKPQKLSDYDMILPRYRTDAQAALGLLDELIDLGWESKVYYEPRTDGENGWRVSLKHTEQNRRWECKHLGTMQEAVAEAAHCVLVGGKREKAIERLVAPARPYGVGEQLTEK